MTFSPCLLIEVWCFSYCEQAVKYIEPQIKLAEKAGKKKREYRLSLISDKSFEKIKSLSEAPIEEVFTDPTYGKVLFQSTPSLSFVFILFFFFLFINSTCWNVG
jgi:hypothetical protein